jgi:nitrile hydratase
MSRMNDLGGMEGFGPVDPADDGQPFEADWEARIYAVHLALLRRGVYGLDEHRDAIERLPPARYLAASAYERWLEAIETLVVEKGLISAADLDAAPEHGHHPAHG